MPISPSSAAQAARENVAQRLRELRADAGITGSELADLCGWTHSKSSRIENARTPPSANDIRLWCRACGADGQAPDIIAQSRNAESMYVEWRRKVRAGLKQLQDSYVPLFKTTKVFRVYSSTLVPGLLQTEGYATGLMSLITAFREIPDDVAQAVAARLERSKILHESGHRFVLLVEETALHHQIGDADAMAAQLGYLLTAGALPAVSLGVIPATGQRGIWPMETFHMYDDTLVSVELLSARVTLTQPSEIAMYLKAFEELRSMAVYGASARALIVKAIEALN
ncbi:transcriptional regulator [Streptomyces agglomeratus]|uniref:Transcriptional regulator n=1 Tax=Streptomyces agglomeratus TaxID=285458 RepID=A0A1E5NYS9_9ACTN|nr:helix-turn-helix transcriptional regulator [Streptomyces agglomeratus]OEJ21331.1 transcriptional regulator [Streptomyces agglomeratus]OEJ22765.1 transcriptional regulator [Streptomyces agglomeratus]OEJ36709.1 transcriptional regulator [Streptomyces agglomeratus]OEJ56435.1 transcriptional regulator [Streptomyces agglomeratus]